MSTSPTPDGEPPAPRRHSSRARRPRRRRGRLAFGGTVDIDDVLRQGITQTRRPVTGNIFHRGGPMRVANATFSPWWSASSEELLRGYEQAFPGQRFSGVIGVDLQALASLFRITGPGAAGALRHDRRGQPGLDGGRQLRPLQLDRRAQAAHNAELVPAFRDQFFSGGQIRAKVKALVGAADGRHFFLYFRDPPLQHRFARVGMSGNLSYTGNDYVGVFSQNTNGSKNDYYQHRAITDDVRQRTDGSTVVPLHVLVQNQAPSYTLPTPSRWSRPRPSPSR